MRPHPEWLLVLVAVAACGSVSTAVPPGSGNAGPDGGSASDAGSTSNGGTVDAGGETGVGVNPTSDGGVATGGGAGGGGSSADGGSGTGRALIVLAAGEKPSAIAINDANVYWINKDFDLRTVSKNGGAISTVAHAGATPTFMLADDMAVYWVSGGTYWRAPLGGGEVTEIDTGSPPASLVPTAPTRTT